MKDGVLKHKLETFSAKNFNNFIPKTILKLEDSSMYTIQFIFWFCHLVEKNLTSILEKSFKEMELIEGKTSDELLDFIKVTHKISFEKIDSTNPKHNPKSITFNDKIDIVEKMRGVSDHTKFLRKVKLIRNGLSHLRLEDLKYNGESLIDNITKAKLMTDYIEQMLSIDEIKNEGGIINTLTNEQKERVDKKYDEWKNKIP